MPRHLFAPVACLLLALGGCASTTVSRLTPSPQEPICQNSSQALVFWLTQWRPDQKDVPDREAAAAEGIGQFFKKSGCFESASLRRLPSNSREVIQGALNEARTRSEKVILIAVRELGPTLKIGASLALIDSATEVVLDLSEYNPGQPLPRTFTVEWRNAESGVLKGVATLAQDIQAALAAGLQPSVR